MLNHGRHVLINVVIKVECFLKRQYLLSLWAQGFGWLKLGSFTWRFAKASSLTKLTLELSTELFQDTTHQSPNLSLLLCVPCSNLPGPVVSNLQATFEEKAWPVSILCLPFSAHLGLFPVIPLVKFSAPCTSSYIMKLNLVGPFSLRSLY